MKKTHTFYLLKFGILFFLTLFFNSCVSKSKIVYFQSNTNDSISVKGNYEPHNLVFKYDDFLAIDVTAIDEESIKPFQLNTTTNSNQVPSYQNGIAAKSGYLIDQNGEIELPLVGKIKIVNLNRIEATELLKQKLSEFISNPVVNIRIQNFKVTVLGDVRNPGTFNIPNERITLPEIIGVAGDLNISGLRKNILLIREENGKKIEYRIDLTSKSIYNSPAYYLSQNDVIYVEPNRAKRNSSMISSTSGVVISVASLIITTINVLTR
jgi:polysaccharide export outer membrane protein